MTCVDKQQVKIRPNRRSDSPNVVKLTITMKVETNHPLVFGQHQDSGNYDNKTAIFTIDCFIYKYNIEGTVVFKGNILNQEQIQ